MTRQRVKSVGVWSVFKFCLVYYLLFFLLFCTFAGIIYLVVALVGTMATPAKQQMSAISGFLGGGVVSIVIAFAVGLFSSIIYAAIAAIGAAIYNLIALISGGIELNLIEKPKKS